jgi:hypothetical protein
MILFCSAAAVQETVQCQFVSEFALVMTVNVALFSLGNTILVRKVSVFVPNVPCAVTDLHNSDL